jgi:RND family efflux transporter MFP subunit
MNSQRALVLFFGLVFLLGAFGRLPALAEELEGKLEGISAPSADIMLSFVLDGQVAEVLVKEGDMVKDDQILARLEDKTERIQLLQLRAQALDTTQVRSVEAELSQKKADLKKIMWAKSKGAATDWEVQHARLDVSITELALQAAKLEHEQYKRRFRQAQSQLERMKLVSPIVGRVETSTIEPGEAARALDPAIQVVKIDPLWIDVPVPLEQARSLSRGNIGQVLFPDADPAEPADAVIINISAVADAASDTIRVRLEVSNPHGRPAGERVSIIFPTTIPLAEAETVQSRER